MIRWRLWSPVTWGGRAEISGQGGVPVSFGFCIGRRGGLWGLSIGRRANPKSRDVELWEHPRKFASVEAAKAAAARVVRIERAAAD